MKGHTKYLGILSAGLDSLLEVLLCYFWGKICYFCVVQGGKGRGKQNPVSVLHVTKFASVWVKEMEKKKQKNCKNLHFNTFPAKQEAGSGCRIAARVLSCQQRFAGMLREQPQPLGSVFSSDFRQPLSPTTAEAPRLLLQESGKLGCIYRVIA